MFVCLFSLLFFNGEKLERNRCDSLGVAPTTSKKSHKERRNRGETVAHRKDYGCPGAPRKGKESEDNTRKAR